MASDEERELERLFRIAIAPSMIVLRELVDVADTAPDRFGHRPSADSVATKELAAQQKQYSSLPNWLEPISEAHSFGSFTLRAAADNIRSFTTVIQSEPTPVYGHLVLARSAMQGCVFARWLNDPTIVPLERIKRGLIEQLHNSRELFRVKALRDKTPDRRQEWKDVAATFGWTVNGNKHSAEVDGEGRPFIPESFSTMLVDDPEVNLGNSLWAYLSSVEHMTLYGLLEAFDRTIPESSPLLPLIVRFGTSSDAVTTFVICLLRMFASAAVARFDLMGWSWPEWTDVQTRAAAMERQLMAEKLAARS